MNKTKSKIWQVFDIANNGTLRQILGNKDIDTETIEALLDIIYREEHRLNRLISARTRTLNNYKPPFSKQE